MSDYRRYRTEVGGSEVERRERVTQMMGVQKVQGSVLKYWWARKTHVTVEQYIEQENRLLESAFKRARTLEKIKNIQVYYDIDQENAEAEAPAEKRRKAEAQQGIYEAQAGQARARREIRDLERDENASMTLDEYKMRQASRDDQFAAEQHRERMDTIKPTEARSPIEIAVEAAELWEKGQEELRAAGYRENDAHWQNCKLYYENLFRHLST